MPKRMLIIKASSDVCSAEIDHLKAVAALLGLESVVVEVDATTCDLAGAIPPGDAFDYVYLAAHANPECFGESDGTCITTWEHLAEILCCSGCLRYSSVLLLACCRGGLRRVAETLFAGCSQIDYICGPRWTVTSCDITAGFHIFMYNMEVRREQPSTAARRSSYATGYDFFCYDRVEIEDHIQYIHEDLDCGSESTSSSTPSSSATVPTPPAILP